MPLREKGASHRDESCDNQAELLQLETLNGWKTPQCQKKGDRDSCRGKTPSDHAQPEKHAGSGNDYEEPGEAGSHLVEWESDRGRQKKSHIDRIGESLLVLRIAGPLGIEVTHVVGGLDRAGDVAVIGSAPMQEQVARTQPARIQIREIAARTRVRGGIGPLVGDENVVDVKPHAGGA